MLPTLSFTVRSWRDPKTGAMQLRVVRVDGESEVPLADALFLVRITTEGGGVDGGTGNGVVHRCCIRHVASGRETYVQGGADLQAFVTDCLLPGGMRAGSAERPA